MNVVYRHRQRNPIHRVYRMALLRYLSHRHSTHHGDDNCKCSYRKCQFNSASAPHHHPPPFRSPLLSLSLSLSLFPSCPWNSSKTNWFLPIWLQTRLEPQLIWQLSTSYGSALPQQTARPCVIKREMEGFSNIAGVLMNNSSNQCCSFRFDVCLPHASAALSLFRPHGAALMPAPSHERKAFVT